MEQFWHYIMFRIDCVWEFSDACLNYIKCLQFLHYRIASSMRQSSYQIHSIAFNRFDWFVHNNCLVFPHEWYRFDAIKHSANASIEHSKTTHKTFLFRQSRIKMEWARKNERAQWMFCKMKMLSSVNFCEWIKRVGNEVISSREWHNIICIYGIFEWERWRKDGRMIVEWKKKNKPS